MTQQKDIRNAFFLEGKKISEISREFNVDPKTVRKYINKDDWNEPAPTVNPKVICPKLNPYKETIDSWLIEDKQARKKQRHTAKRVFDRLNEAYSDFAGSYRSVATYVGARKKELYQKTSCSLPLEHIPGEAQVDFGYSDYKENGQIFQGSHLNISFPNSNSGYTLLFKGENLECLLEGLKTIFEHLNGVPCRLWFDNASAVVTQIKSEGERKLTDGFMRFQQHYGFEAAFCNPYSGKEKGSVEKKVGYHRQNLLVPIPEITDWEKFNKTLLEKCDKDARREHYRKEAIILDLFQADKEALLPLPAVDFEVCKYITVKTNGYAKFSLNDGKHTYSVAPRYAKQSVLVKVTAFSVIPLDDSHREIVHHKRFYGDKKQESMQWLPYLTQLSRSPGALKYSGIYKMLPDPLKDYLDGIKKSEQGQVLRVIARLTLESNFDKAVDAVAQALHYGSDDLDSLVALHQRIAMNIPDVKPVKLPPDVPALAPFKPDMQAYDAIINRSGEQA